jgi:hypothetical protein
MHARLSAASYFDGHSLMAIEKASSGEVESLISWSITFSRKVAHSFSCSPLLDNWSSLSTKTNRALNSFEYSSMNPSTSSIPSFSCLRSMSSMTITRFRYAAGAMSSKFRSLIAASAL